MKVIEERYDRCGDKGYDTEYINWGFDSLEEQEAMARKIQALLGGQAKDVLDVACGIGRYHAIWLKAGHRVTGIDISETFIDYAREYNKHLDAARYIQCDFREMMFHEEFDAAVWTDPVGLTGLPVFNIFAALRPSGRFIYEMWNEHYYRKKFKEGQTWTRESNKYMLIRHEYNPSTSATEHEEIVFDVDNDTMVHKTGFDSKNTNHHCSVQILEAAGFKNVRFVTYDGQPFDPPDSATKRFFLLGEK
jgi:SAM-dependent methyltransferase